MLLWSKIDRNAETTLPSHGILSVIGKKLHFSVHVEYIWGWGSLGSDFGFFAACFLTLQGGFCRLTPALLHGEKMWHQSYWNKQRTSCYAYTTDLMFVYFWLFPILTDHRLTFQPQNGVWSEICVRGIFKTFIFNDSIYEAWGLGLKKGLFS